MSSLDECAPSLFYASKWVGDNRQPAARNPEIRPSKERERSPLTSNPLQRRSFEREIVDFRQPPPRRLGRFGVSAGYGFAVVLGIIIGLSATGVFPSMFVETFRVGTKVSEFTSTLDHSTGAVIAAPSQLGNGAINVATLGATAEPAPIVRGVTASEIRFGFSAPLIGRSRELGQNRKMGIAAYLGTSHPIAMSSTIVPRQQLGR
jgi:hypothetical protein